MQNVFNTLLFGAAVLLPLVAFGVVFDRLSDSAAMRLCQLFFGMGFDND